MWGCPTKQPSADFFFLISLFSVLRFPSILALAKLWGKEQHEKGGVRFLVSEPAGAAA